MEDCSREKATKRGAEEVAEEVAEEAAEAAAEEAAEDIAEVAEADEESAEAAAEEAAEDAAAEIRKKEQKNINSSKMKRIILCLVVVASSLLSVELAAQNRSKPAMDHSVYDSWKTLSKPVVFNAGKNGNSIIYTVAEQEGDKKLVIYNIKTGKEQVIERLGNTRVSADGQWVVGVISATFQQRRTAQINREKKRPNAEAPKDTLAIINVASGKITKYPNSKNYSVPPLFNTGYVAFMLTPDKNQNKPAAASKTPKDTLKAGKQVARSEKMVESEKIAGGEKVAGNEKVAGSDKAAAKPAAPAPAAEDNLYVLNLQTQKIDTIKRVSSFNFMRNGTLSYITKMPEEKKKQPMHKSDSLRINKDTISIRPDTLKAKLLAGQDTLQKRAAVAAAHKAVTKTDLRLDVDTMKFGLFLYEPATKAKTEILSGRKGDKILLPTRNTKTGNYAFLAQIDTNKKAKNNFAVYFYNGKGQAFKVADTTSAGLPEGWILSEGGKLYFSQSGNRLYFATKPKPREADTTIYNFERAKLDIWSWDADYNQPEQLLDLQKNQAPAYQTYVNVKDASRAKVCAVHKIAEEDIDIRKASEGYGDCEYLLATSDKPYRIQQQWNVVQVNDIYQINANTGQKKLIAKNCTFRFPSATTRSDKGYMVAYNYADSSWVSVNVKTGEMRNLTKDIPSEFYDDSNDRPMPAEGYDGLTYLSDNSVLIPDKYDLWKVDLEGKRPTINFTNGYGKQTNRRLRVIKPTTDTTEFSNTTIDINKPIYIMSFNRTNKEAGLYVVNAKNPKAAPKLQQLTEQPTQFKSIFMLGGKTPVVAYAKGNFEDGTNMWVTTDMFKTEKQISDINPQQRDYNWGTVELFKWKTADGIDSEGLLYKPEDFDPNKKYPVMIYFYEKYSNELYSPKIPAPSRSTICIPMFVSNGYIVFVPDMYYKDGHPGKSAMRSLMPAVEKLEKDYSWIDGSKMAIQGQSWGGYQVAYIITQTDKFAAAGAGAPVANMTSAYGGIRWGTGMTRQFQYEQTQSRIGKNLWDGFDLYVENSPLFFLPAVKTPVLIMHNDRDGAVPWYQGIELFTGLRRLGKKAWMLQYNGEDHNLTQRSNSKDLSIRLQQFFDHYLKGAPAPKWMSPHGRPAVDKAYTMGYEIEEDD